MKICVSTLKTIEQEFATCKNMIQAQQYGDFEHIVYENLPNHEAHVRLYGDFLDRKNEFDILVKVDADTVLYNDQFLNRVVSLFREHSDVEQIQFQLFDFFTNKPIWGLNCYRNTIVLKTQDSLFVDRFVTRSAGKKLDLKGEIVGNHSPNPSDFQCLHFGFHRQLKRQYKQIIIPMLRAYLLTLDRRRGLALIGCILVQKGILSKDQNFVYEDPLIKNLSAEYSKKHGIKLFGIIVSGFVSYFFKKLPLIVKKDI